MEFAPYQKVVLPKENRRRDPKLNTLDQDPDYLRFLELLAAGPEVGLISNHVFLLKIVLFPDPHRVVSYGQMLDLPIYCR